MTRKIQKHIEIVRSSVPALSSLSQKSCNSLFALLSAHYETVGVTTINTELDLENLKNKQPDLVFMGMKYAPGLLPDTKIWISDYLDAHNIAHTGSPKNAIESEQDKPLAKQRVLDAGVTTSPYIIVHNGEPMAKTAGLLFPMFVKPANLGAGLGVDLNSVVHTLAELNAKTASVFATYATDALVEHYLSGREFSVAILKYEYSDEVMALPLELVAGVDVNGDRMLSEELKSAPLETPVLAVVNKDLRAKLAEVARGAFTALGARDYGRIDIRLDAKGVPHFLEANLIPCLIRGSGNFPKACLMNIGMDYDAMILHIVRLAFARVPVAVTAYA